MLPDGYTPLPPGKIAAVVTYLEMRQKPALPPYDPPQDFSIRRVPKPDPGWYRQLFRSIGEDWLWFSRLRLSDEQLSAIIGNDRVDVFALEHDGVAKGLLELDRRHATDIELLFFGVTRDLIGRGAGRYLMRRAIEEAWSHSPSRFFLHTCTLDHPKAIGFYLKSGFTPYRRAIEISDDPRLTGELPRHCAPHIPLIG